MTDPTPNQQASTWLDSFGDALTRRDSDAALALFGDDCYWRDLVSPAVADKVGKVWGLGSDTPKGPGPWEGELRNMWKPTQVPHLWIHGGNLHQSRHYSQFLSLQLKARMEGLPTPVYGQAAVHHTN